jgi:hypothetical protein
MITEPAANDPTMDLQQAADFLHLGLKSMKELVDSGEVPALSLNQKHTILLRDDLITFVREQGRKQADKRRSRKIAPPPAANVPTTKPRCVRARKSPKPDLSAYEASSRASRPNP